MTHSHTMPDGTVTEHSHDEPHGATPEEEKIIREFAIVVEAAVSLKLGQVPGKDTSAEHLAHQEKLLAHYFIKAFNGIAGAVDCYIHNHQFRAACDRAGVRLVYGRKADRRRRHAYVTRYAESEGAICTIQTDIDLDPHDTTIPWANHDLFTDHDEIKSFSPPVIGDTRLVIRYKEM